MADLAAAGPPHLARLVGFVVVFLALLGLGAAGIGWYARGGYFVGLRGNQLTIFQGRPGGLLWFRPTIAATTDVTSDQVESRHLPALASGQVEPTLPAARQFVAGMVTEEQAAQAADQPAPRPKAPTTAPARTTPTSPWTS